MSDMEQDISKAQNEAGKANMRCLILENLTNQLLIREAFLMEIIRRAGLIVPGDIPEIEAAVRERYATSPPFAVKRARADLNVQSVIGELSGVFKSPDDYKK